MGFSLQFCSAHTVNQLRLSNVSFKVMVVSKQTCVYVERVFCNGFSVFLLHASCLLQALKYKNKSKKIQFLSALLEGRSEEQLQQESSQTRENTDRGTWFEQQRQCLMNFLQFQLKLYPKYQ